MPAWQRYAIFALLAGMSLCGMSLAHLAGPGADYNAMLVGTLLGVLAVVAGRETIKWMQRYDARHGLGQAGGPPNAGRGASVGRFAGWKVTGGAAAGSALGFGLWQSTGPSSVAFTLGSLFLAYVGGMMIGPEPVRQPEEIGPVAP